MGSDQELRGSIAAVGCLDPVLIWQGMVIDGRRRHQICGELGIVPPMHVSVTLKAACSALWQRHPDRALVLAREHLGGHEGLSPTVRELAEVCSVSVSAISVELVRGKPKKPPEKRAPHRTRSQRTELMQVWVEPQWSHYVRLAGATHGMNLSATVRHACWLFVQETLPRPPTEGSYRGPSVESVSVKREHRRGLKAKP